MNEMLGRIMSVKDLLGLDVFYVNRTGHLRAAKIVGVVHAGKRIVHLCVFADDAEEALEENRRRHPLVVNGAGQTLSVPLTTYRRSEVEFGDSPGEWHFRS